MLYCYFNKDNRKEKKNFYKEKDYSINIFLYISFN